MNSKHADNDVVEEIYEEYTVSSRNSKEQITVYEVNRHKKLIEDHIIDPIQQNIEKAGAEVYVFGPHMKNMYKSRPL